MQRLLLLCLGAAAALRSEPHSSATSGSIPDGVLGAAAKSLFDLVNGVKQEWKQRKAEKARGSSLYRCTKLWVKAPGLQCLGSLF